MNITFLAGNLGRSSGGIRSTVLPLAREIALRDQSVSVISAGSDDTIARDLAPARLIALDAAGPKQFRYTPGMQRALEATSAEVVHTHGLWMYTSIVASKWSRRNCKPRVVSTHGMLNEFAMAISSRKKKIALNLYEYRHLRKASCIHALTDAEHDAIREFGLDNPVCVIGNGVDFPSSADKSTSAPWHRADTTGKKVLLYLGRLHHIKGLDALIRAWHSARETGAGREWILVVAGWDDDDYEEQLHDLVDQLQLSDSVLFPGAQFGTEKTACFANCDAFVLPSRSEGFPMTVLEAWSFGLPVIMTRQCNVPVGFEREAAIEVDASEESIAAGLERLFTMSREERVEMGNRGRELAGNEFSWSGIAARTLELYRWLTSSGPQPDFVHTI